MAKTMQKPRRETENIHLNWILGGFFLLVMLFFIGTNTVFATNFVNSTAGFQTAGLTATNVEGLGANTTNIFIADRTDGWVYVTTIAGVNVSAAGFEMATLTGAGSVTAINGNGTDFWILDSVDDWVYHINSAGANASDGFDTATAGAANPSGMAYNGSDFWITDIDDNAVYHFDSDGTNSSSGGFGVPADSLIGITIKDGELWIADNGRSFINHYTVLGVNQSDGFNTITAGATGVTGIATDGESLFVFDNTDNAVYRFDPLVTISLQTPADNYQSAYKVVEFNCSAEVLDGNTIANISIYHNLSGTHVMNQTKDFTASTPTLASNKFSVNDTALGNWSWSCRADDNSSNTDFADTNRTWTTWYFKVDGQNYTNETSEQATETFSINLTHNSTFYPNIQGVLWYDDVSYVGTKVGTGDVISFTRDLVIPTVAAEINKTFHWQIIVSNGTDTASNVSSENLSVLNFAIDDCSAYTNQIFNFSVVDEKTQTALWAIGNNTLVNIEISLSAVGSSTELTNYSAQFSQVNSSAICSAGSLGTSSYEVDALVEYSTTNRFTEFYHVEDFILTSSTAAKNITLYNLNDSQGQGFKITYKDSNFVPVAGALVQIQRKYIEEGLFKTTEIPKTNAEGYTIGHLVPDDVIYNIIIVKDGITLATFTDVVADCQNPLLVACTVNLNQLGSSIVPARFNNENDFSFTLSYNTTSREVESIYTIPSGVSSTVLLNVTLFDNLGNHSICSDSLTSAGGALSCTVPVAFGNSTVIASLYKDDDLVGYSIFRNKWDTEAIYGTSLMFMALFIFITIAGLALGSDSPIGFAITLILGSIVMVSMNLLYVKSWIGSGATLLWFILAVVLLLIKGSNRQ